MWMEHSEGGAVGEEAKKFRGIRLLGICRPLERCLSRDQALGRF